MPSFRKTTFGYIVGVAVIVLPLSTIFIGRDSASTRAILLLSNVLFVAGVVYFFMVIHRIHKVLRAATNGKYPISPARAVGFSFIPFYNLYWLFKWPGEIAVFLNHIVREERFKKNRWGWLLLLASFSSIILPGLSILINFLILDKIMRGATSTLSGAAIPIEDYSQGQYKSSVAIWIIAVPFFFMFMGLIAAIAIPNFVKARQDAQSRLAAPSAGITP